MAAPSVVDVRAPALGKAARGCVAPGQERRKQRYWGRYVVRTLARRLERQKAGSSSFARIIGCGVFPVAGRSVGIAVRSGLDGPCGYEVGVQHCGSVWTCPVCSAKIRARRAVDLGALCERYTADGGWLVMVTFTMRHSREDSLEGERHAMTRAWSSLRQSPAFRDLGPEVDGFVCATEVTDGENGWHLHKHVLFFVPGSSAGDAGATGCGVRKQAEVLSTDLPTTRLGSVMAMIGALAPLWCRLIERHTGKVPVRERAFDMQLMNSGAGVYLSKVGDELTRSDVKGRSPFGLLHGVAAGEPRAIARWIEYADTMKGAHALEYSKGLRELLGALPELSDDEIVAQDEGGVIVEWLPASEWYRLCESFDSEGVSLAFRRLEYWEARARSGPLPAVRRG